MWWYNHTNYSVDESCYPMQRNKIIIINDDLFFFLLLNNVQSPTTEPVNQYLKWGGGYSLVTSIKLSKTWSVLIWSWLQVMTSICLRVLPYISESDSSPTIHFRFWQFSHHTFQNLTVLPWYVSVILQFYHDTFQ